LPTVLRGGGRAQRGGRPGAVIVVVHGVSAGRRRDGLVLPTSLAGRSCSWAGPCRSGGWCASSPRLSPTGSPSGRHDHRPASAANCPGCVWQRCPRTSWSSARRYGRRLRRGWPCGCAGAPARGARDRGATPLPL